MAASQVTAQHMQRSEADQLDAFVRFIKADKALRKALTNQKWAVFAKRYNGSNYAQNLYDVKLAVNTWQRQVERLELQNTSLSQRCRLRSLVVRR